MCVGCWFVALIASRLVYFVGFRVGVLVYC